MQLIFGMWNDSASPQTVSQLATRPVKPCLHSSFRATHYGRDFGATEILLIKQQKTETVIFSQLANGRLQLVGEIRRSGGIHGNRLVQLLGTADRISGALSQRSATAIGRDRKNPRFQRSRRIPPFKTPEGPKEDVLGDVFRIFALPQHAETKREYERLEPLDQLARSRILAAETALDQGCIVGQLDPLCFEKQIPGPGDCGFSNSS
jgi:hypothetical protein